MEANLFLLIGSVVLIACGVYLMLDKSMTRMIMGVTLIGNGANLLLLQSGGPAGSPPIIGRDSEAAADSADPLAQAQTPKPSLPAPQTAQDELEDARWFSRDEVRAALLEDREDAPLRSAPADMTPLEKLRRHVETTSDYVGMSFAAEARAMHEGTRPERAIHGEARIDEARKLLEDGIPVAPLPFRPRSRVS